MLREKRSKRRNDGSQTANIALDRFDSTEAQNDFSETLLTVNLGSEPILQTQTSSTPSVNAPDNTRDPIAVSLPSSLKEELLKDDYIYVPSDNDCLAEPEKQAAEESFPRKTEPEPPLNVAARPRQWEDDVPSFNFGISPPASQPITLPSQVTVTQQTQPSEPTVSDLEVLADAMVDVGVTKALKFAEATTVELSFIAAEVYKTPEKE
ncbi:uncharacterized protein DS421_20g702120 [Arachis hypogaea]|nr:uncharacterized protein DS421_20g702120 [Arachis hypogaea]